MILLLGASGQLGRHLQRVLTPRGALAAPARDEPGGDLTQPEALADAALRLRPQLIVNAAAWTDVDRAEREPEAAFAVNARACEVLAEVARRLDAWLVHFSTDYVFDGRGDRPWTEADVPAPLNVYGRSKLAGEQAVARWPRHLVLRTSWLYDSVGENFLTAILCAARRRPTLDVVDDAWGAPTHAAALATLTAQVLERIEPRHAGLYHACAQGVTSWYGCASLALDTVRASGVPLALRADGLRPVRAADTARAARRPANSRLDCSRLRNTFDLTLGPWEDDLRAAAAAWAEWHARRDARAGT